MTTPPRDPFDDIFAAEPYIDDDGFTTHVLARLPRRRRRARPIILGVSTALAAAIAVIALPGLLLGIQATLLAALPSVPPGALLAAGAAGAAAVVGALCLALAE